MQHHYVYPEESFILVGTVVKAQGLRGEVSIHALSGQPGSLGNYSTFTLVDPAGTLSPELRVQAFRLQKEKAIILFDRVTDRSHAETLVGMGVLVAKADLPELADDEFYWYQLTGLAVRTVQGRQLGTMRSVFSNGAQDVMVISDGNSEYLVPLCQGIIVLRNTVELVIDPPPGLLEINAEDDLNGTEIPA